MSEAESSRAPALGRTSFECPYCGANSQQQWADLLARLHKVDDPVRPFDSAFAESVIQKAKPDERKSLQQTVDNITSPYPKWQSNDDGYARLSLLNVNISQCFSCKELTVWLKDRIIFPQSIFTIQPNPDLPADILDDYREASAVLSASPRAAAALLRLAIQRLCNHLGKTGDINSMIADLVGEGLPVRVQQALDVVRVIGNESVHPGTIDLNDTPAAAEQLFMLVNLIAEKTISEPKHVAEMFALIPPEKLAAIEKRNLKAKDRSAR